MMTVMKTCFSLCNIHMSLTTHHRMSAPGHLGLAWCRALLMVLVLVMLQLHLVTSHSLNSSSVGMVGGSPNRGLGILRQIYKVLPVTKRKKKLADLEAWFRADVKLLPMRLNRNLLNIFLLFPKL